jgi:hypothetical protein
MPILGRDHSSMVVVWRAFSWESGSHLIWDLRRDASPEVWRYLQLASSAYTLVLLGQGLEATYWPTC